MYTNKKLVLDLAKWMTIIENTEKQGPRKSKKWTPKKLYHMACKNIMVLLTCAELKRIAKNIGQKSGMVC